MDGNSTWFAWGCNRTAREIRTYGTYQVSRNGKAVSGLNGFMCEANGKGDLVSDSGHRLKEGRYRLSTADGPNYKTVDYPDADVTDQTSPRPGILLLDTRPRYGIIVHPAHPKQPPHPDDLYLSSIGCLNPTSELNSDEDMDWSDSRQRVIDLIEDLKTFDPPPFVSATETLVQNAWIVIDGEPMTTYNKAILVASNGSSAKLT